MCATLDHNGCTMTNAPYGYTVAINFRAIRDVCYCVGHIFGLLVKIYMLSWHTITRANFKYLFVSSIYFKISSEMKPLV